MIWTAPANSIPGSREGEFFMNCPKCIDRVGKEDTKFHLGISMTKSVCHCFRCGWKGRLKDIEFLMSFASQDYEDEEADKIQMLRDQLKRVRNPHAADLENEEKLDLEAMSMVLSKENTPFAYEYMTGRGFSEDELKKYNIRVGREFNDYHSGRVIRKWSGRVLFPFMTPENIMEYVIGRSINGKDPKYVNQRKDKSGIVYNIYNIKNRKCILCEGVISALAAERVSGISSIAVLGKYMTDTQIYKIREKVDDIIYSFDGDVDFKTVRSNVRKLLRAGFSVQYLRLPSDQDPDSLGKEFMKYVDNPLSPYFLRESYEYGHS